MLCYHQKGPTTFNSRPHKEVDVTLGSCPEFAVSFNSRPHKEVDFPKPIKPFSCEIFQFTTSQGGRRYFLSGERPELSAFNSRPHKEVDALEAVDSAL